MVNNDSTEKYLYSDVFVEALRQELWTICSSRIKIYRWQYISPFSVQRVLLISRGFPQHQPTWKFLHCILRTKISTYGIARETISSSTTLTLQENSKNLTLIQCCKLTPELKVNQELAQAS